MFVDGPVRRSTAKPHSSSDVGEWLRRFQETLRKPGSSASAGRALDNHPALKELLDRVNGQRHTTARRASETFR